ncbi:MAG: amidohydrolase [Pseudorhodobacter sp.]
MTATLLLNARIRTMDPARPFAEAVLIRSGRIAAVGDAAALRVQAPGARVIDAGGRLCLPGFQDAHVHLLDGGVDLVVAAPLWEVATLPGLCQALSAHAAACDLPLVMGAGWQAGVFGDHNLSAAVLDAVVPDRPVMLYDSSYHLAVVNSAALRMAGIGVETGDPPKGHFVRDGDGKPTGMLHEEATRILRDRLPPIGTDTHFAGLMAAQSLANRHGITGILDPRIEPHNAAAYARAAAEGRLTLRVAGAALVTPEDTAATALPRLTALRAAHPGPMFHVHSAKFFLDGVFENGTAACLAPCMDGTNADTMFDPAAIRVLFTALDAARFQIHVHAIGDAATRAALDGIEAARGTNGPWPARHQIAHLQLVHPHDMPRLAALGAMANIQPLWARFDPAIPDIALDLIGQDRWPMTYPFRALLDAGATACLSSDWPVTTLNPFPIIETAVTRRPQHHEGMRPTFQPEHCLTVEEAVAGYTIHAAAACWREDLTGMIRPGLSADLILLDRDIFACAPEEIGGAQVDLTLFEGREVHRAPGFGG